MNTQDTLDFITASDREYQDRKPHIKITEPQGRKKAEHNKGTCFYPGCDREVYQIGLCKYHKAQHYNGALLKIDTGEYEHEEIMELYHDIITLSEKLDMEIPELVPLLILKGARDLKARLK